MKDKEELDKLKERINCSEDSDCNYCPYAVREECLLDLYNKLKDENRKLRNCHLRYEEMTGIDLLLED